MVKPTFNSKSCFIVKVHCLLSAQEKYYLCTNMHYLLGNLVLDDKIFGNKMY